MAIEAPRRERILEGARRLLETNEKPTVNAIASAAGTSKAGFYREFDSRAALLEALRLEPEPGTRERILAAGLEMVSQTGLTALSMDELAGRAGVSRATLYRLFPGKPALFLGILKTYSPMEAVRSVIGALGDQPPEVVMPELARTVRRAIAGPGAPRLGMLKAVFFEVSSLTPDAEAAAQEVAATVLGSVGAYLIGQMAAGRLRPMQPVLALQSFIGPIFFHLLTTPMAERMLGLEIDGEAAVTALAENWLRAMKPEAREGGAHE
jgi:AcrR family transcriptional regulator